jgi:hypothetical protein
MADRVQQIADEIVAVGSPNARIAQLADEVVALGSPNARVQHLCVELIFPYVAIVSPTTQARIQVIT